jgi:o-succinylbenzoate synthase
MRIGAVRLHPYDLALKRAWRTASAEASRRQGWLVEVQAGEFHGFGDCTTPPGHHAEGADADALMALGNRLVGADVDEALAVLSGPSAARAAVECALLDVQAQMSGLPLCRLLDPQAACDVAVNAVTAVQSQAFADAAGQGYRVIKVKVGLSSARAEAEGLCALSIPAGVSLRLDANQAWNWDDAACFLDAVAGLPIESVEEPLAQPSLSALARLQAGTAISLAMDESLGPLGPQAVVEQRPVRRLVLKPGMLGGLRASYALATRARAAGLDCVVTSALDSAVGVVAAAHLAAAVDIKGRLAHGLSTSDWLAEDVAVPLAVRHGRMELGKRPGLGIVPL